MTCIFVQVMIPPSKARNGRGAISNPQGRFESRRVEAVDDGWSMDTNAELPPLATTVTAEHAKSIISRNASPDIPFEQSINPYRGCGHGCVYCQIGDTQILMTNGRTKLLGDLKKDDEIIGTQRRGAWRRYVKTRVLAHWETYKPAYRLMLADGTTLTASAEHRFLSDRGWKYVTGTEQGRDRRPHLSAGNKLLGVGMTTGTLAPTSYYRQGYLCGMIRGDGYRGGRKYALRREGQAISSHFRLALADREALQRSSSYLAEFGIQTRAFLLQKATATCREMHAISAGVQAGIRAIEKLIAWPGSAPTEWIRGFLGGIFDAEGSYSEGIVRVSNTDHVILSRVEESLKYFGFASTFDAPSRGTNRPVQHLRVLGEPREHLRFFHLVDPAITRKRTIFGQAVKSQASLAVVEIEPLGVSMPMYDITTGTGDFIANGVISHNCYARPAHSYMNLSPGLDFETKLFYKENAAELLKAELSRPRYVCKSINLGANTDPYQPIERTLKVTRSILQVLQEFRHPVTIVTKGHLIERDLDILAAMARDNLASVHVSVTTLDPELKRILEPRAPSHAARLHAIRCLKEAGVPVGALVAPVIPAVNDREIEHILEAVAGAGARRAAYVMLRLPYEVKDLFREWLERHYPLRAAHVMSLVRDIRGGRENDPRFGSRMIGTGAFAELVRRRFEVACRRLALNAGRGSSLDTKLFRVPQPPAAQLNLGF
jgi:DNA repair photolyase